ncbi:Smr/MutS family protein [bacterium]|jgi:DNA-nicking Smr family endonuclease|nr:Smr/MutS family protein [bacterium]MBT6831870.1 Smr/MutS family protein [bacterium]MBT6996524.1 Smr/MutS family protein [bacterium]MBT7773017.1 Smr/MutS family protein [bacterium]
MKKNKYEQKIDATLDLHGMSSWEAFEAIDIFLERARHNHFSRVKIITGKGLHSKANPVLRSQTMKILNEKKLKFSTSKMQEGGTGAFVVSL